MTRAIEWVLFITATLSMSTLDGSNDTHMLIAVGTSLILVGMLFRRLRHVTRIHTPSPSDLSM